MARPQGVPELPPGFGYGHFEEYNVHVPVPDGWTAKAYGTEVDPIYIVSPDLVRLGSEITYETGLSVGMLKNLPHKPSDVALYCINSATRRGMVPASDLETVQEDPFVTHRRIFTHAGGSVAGLTIGPMSFYLSATANESQGVVYTATFETPAPEWERFRDTARIMIHGLVFDPNMGNTTD